MSDPQNPGGWPDASRPGVPMHPERSGWHFLQHPEDLHPVPTPWDAAHAAWCSGGMHSPQGVIDLGYHYAGPCLTPAEVEAEKAAARREGIEAAWGVVADETVPENGLSFEETMERDQRMMERIRALLEDGR